MSLSRNLPRIFASAVFATAGCGSTELRTLDDYEPGTTPHAQFVRGASLCDKQAESDEKSMGPGPLDPTHSTYNRMFDACMRASGFARKPPQ